MKVVIYTGIFGKAIGLVKQPKFKNIDYVCFTDQDIKSTQWDVRKVVPKFEDASRNNRYYKILPHLNFEEYDLSIYIDANYLIIGDINNLLETIVKDNLFMCFSHANIVNDPRNCIYKEFKHIVKLGDRKGKYKDNVALMEQQINRYKSEGYPEENGQIRGSVLIRRHNNPSVISLMETWWNEVSNNSKRDQLSCNYSAWKENFKIKYLPGDALRGNLWFYNLGTNRKNFTKKILEFRIKHFFGKAVKISSAK